MINMMYKSKTDPGLFVLVLRLSSLYLTDYPRFRLPTRVWLPALVALQTVHPPP